MSCASLGCQPQGFKFKWILSPSHRSAASRPIGVRGKGVQFLNDLGFAPQAIAYRASSTQERNFKKRQRGIGNNLDAIPRSRFGFVFSVMIRMQSVVVGAVQLGTRILCLNCRQWKLNRREPILCRSAVVRFSKSDQIGDVQHSHRMAFIVDHRKFADPTV